MATVTGVTVSGGTASGGTVTAEYLYDTSGALVTTVNNGGMLVRAILRANGQHWGDYIGAAGSGGVRTEFRLVNAVGTLVANGDTNGNFIEGCLSGPFGDGEDCTPSYDYSETHFADKLRDSQTNNDYFGARYFNSIMGRFTSPDWALVPTPIPFATLDNPQSLNLYSYVGNNPLSTRDADGHRQVCDPDKSSTDKDGTLTITAGACREVSGGLGSFLLSLNPFGKLGGPAHRATVNKLADMLQKDGFEVSKEVKVPTPNGSKGSRYVDVVGAKKSTGETKMYQVGASNKDGSPVAREVRAMDDIEQATGMRPQFEDKGLAAQLENIESGVTPLIPNMEGASEGGIAGEPDGPIEMPPL